MSCELRDYILANSDWEEKLTKEPYNLTIKRDGDYMLLKYSQISSDFSIPLVREARGIIFYESTMQVVCRPFDKFFNYGEENAAEIDWRYARVTEKIDGSLIKVWFHHGWHVSTNSTIDARKAFVNDLNMTFYDLFMKALDYPKECFWAMLETENTYMFELVSPYTRVVIPYEETKLYYLYARNTKTGRYVFYPMPVYSPKSFNFTDLDSIIEEVSTLDWTKEGFVVFDGINRIKVKSPAYIKAHYARNNGNISIRILLEIVRANEQEEFLTYAPEYKDYIWDIKNRISELERNAEAAAANLVFCANKIDVAMLVKQSNYDKCISGYLYDKFSKGVTFKEYFNKLTTKAAMRALKLKESEEKQ